MDLKVISDEISRLESSKASYPTCQRLADLYIVKENLMKKQGGNYERNNYGYYERGGNSGNSSSYGMYDYDERMMDDEMGMRGSRMSMPVMR